MKVVIFAGGKGTRISEETTLKPKPMIDIGGKPILWHIMKIYETFGHDEFIICCGYKGWMIKEYFLNYYKHNSDLTIDLENNELEIHKNSSEKFKITLVDTGLDTMTAGRLQKVLPYIGNETFMLTYGDGLADVDLHKLLEFHKEKNKICTMTAIQVGSRFGVLDISESGDMKGFQEKPKDSGTWINGGFFIINPEVKKYLTGNMEEIMWEQEPLINLTKDNEIVAFKHHGFWKCMDTMRDKTQLEEMWESNPLWKKW